MFDEQLRQFKDRALLPAARRIGTRVHPNTVTLIGGVVGLAAGLAGFQGAYSLGLALWLANRTLDGLDGALARVTGQQSASGGYIDILTDFLVYAFVPLMLALGRSSEAVLVALALLLSAFYINAASWMYLAALLERSQATGAAQTSVVMPTGLIEGAETVVFFALSFIFPAHLVLLFSVMAVLVMATVVQRLLWALPRLRTIDSPRDKG